MKTLGLFLVAAFAGTLFAQAPPQPQKSPRPYNCTTYPCNPPPGWDRDHLSQVQPATPPQIGTTTVTGPHQAVLNWSNASCTNNAQCSIQVYRATCTSPSTCPTYTAGSSAWTALNMTANLAPTVGASGTTWVYTDKDPALQDSTTYAWVATNIYVGGTNPSPASANYSGTTNNGTPPAPTLATSGNSVN